MEKRFVILQDVVFSEYFAGKGIRSGVWANNPIHANIHPITIPILLMIKPIAPAIARKQHIHPKKQNCIPSVGSDRKCMPALSLFQYPR